MSFEISRSENSVPRLLLTALGAAVFMYWLLDFVITPNTLSPLHHDDYAVLGAGAAKFRWLVERPVSTNLAYLMGEWGPRFAYVLENLLTAAVPACVLAFVFLFLRLPLPAVAAVSFAAFVFCHASALEHGKYLGLITNLTSHAFGVASLLLLMWAWMRPAALRVAAAAAVYALSVFAKEDFLLPPLVLLAYFGAETWFPRAESAWPAAADPQRRKWWIRAACAFGAIAFASVAFSFIVRNPFVSGMLQAGTDSSPYSVSFAPAVLFMAFGKLTFGYAQRQTITAIVACVVLLVAWPQRRRELAALIAMVLGIVLPYALIINQAPAFRAFAWLPWLAAISIALAGWLWTARSGFGVRRILAALLVAWVWFAAAGDQPYRLGVAEWYAGAQQKTQSMLNSVIANKPALIQEKVVGVIGLEGLSPWSKTDGNYLKNKLGFGSPWIVFVPKPDMFYPERDLSVGSYISVLPMARLCDNPSLLLMRFDKFGNGSPVRASSLCGAQKPAEIESVPPKG